MHTKMASPSLFKFLLLFFLLSMIINPSHSSELNTADDMVTVSLYYETLCPYSRSFIANQLWDLFKTDLMSVVNLYLVPYGNALTQANGTVDCQHGPVECYYNTIEACALDAWPVRLTFPFIHCVEAGVPTIAWGTCCSQLRLNPKTIENCYTGGRGNQLIIRNGKETDGLNPPLQYVPWVVVDNQHIPDVQNLLFHVCNAYKGAQKFRVCQGKVVTTSTETMTTSTQAVCLANEGVSP